MRLSGLVIASILLASTPLLAQHSSGGGGASSGGSHGGYSGGSVGSASSASSHASSSSASHASSTSMVSHSAPSFKSPPSKDITPEKQSSRSFFHPFRKAKPVQTAELKVPSLCLKGQCAICPRGQARNRNGACVAASNACSAGQPWNGFSCGWSNNCNMLARELEEQRSQMQNNFYYGQSLRYRMLQQQYQECLTHSRSSFGAYAFNDARLLDTP